MNLPNAHLTVVDRNKVVGYLLNAAHPGNGGKARFFESLGFSLGDPERLVTALRAVAVEGEIVETARSVHGHKYVVEGWLSAHTERGIARLVRTVWIVDRGGVGPRFVTAYPGTKRSSE